MVAERIAARRGAVGSSTWWEPLPVVAFVVVALALWPLMAVTHADPDSVSYLSVAEHWAAGRWSDAINGYWSPLVSWATAPGIAVGLPALRVGEAVSIASGAFALWRTVVLLRVVGVDVRLGGILVLGAVPFMLHATFIRLLAPDVLMAACLLGFLSSLLDDRTSAQERSARAGVWAGAAFLAKAYALPFVLAHLVVWAVIRRRWRREPNGDTLRVAGTTLGVFGLVALVWIVPLSIRYEGPTFSTAGSYNVRVTGPGSSGQPFLWAGLIEPTGPNAVSAWEEPSIIDPETSAAAEFDQASVSGGGSGTEAAGRLARIADNVAELSKGAGSMIGTVVLATIASVGVALGLVRRRVRGPIVHVVGATGVYIGGLLVVFVNWRYLAFPLLLSCVVAAWFVQTELRPRIGPRRALALALVVAMIGVPLSSVGLIRAERRNATDDALGAQFDRVVRPGARVATSDLYLTASLGTCYRVGCTYLGTPVESDVDGLVEQLRRARVDLYVVDAGDAVPPAPAQAVGPGPFDGSEVFDVSPYREAAVGD